MLRTEAHPIMLTASVLSMVSAFIGRRVYADIYTRLYANLWFICIAGSGRFKTTALSLGTRIASKKDTAVINRLAQLNSELKFESLKDAKVAIQKEMDELRSVQLAWNPEGGSLRAFLGRIALGGTHVLCLSEFGSFLRSMSKEYNSGFKQALTNLYDVPESGSYETQVSGNLYYERPYFSLCGMSTPEWMQQEAALEDATGGFYARFLMYKPQIPFKQNSIIPEKRSAIDHEVQLQADTVFESHLKRSLESLGERRVYTFSDAAAQTVEEYGNQMRVCLGDLYDQEPYCSFVGRWGPYLIKLSMIMQFLTDSSPEISPSAVDSAWNVLLPSIKSTMSLFTKELMSGKNEQLASKVLNYIARKTAQQGYAARQQLFSSKCIDAKQREYDEILALLIERGEVVEETAEKKMNYRYRYTNTK